MKIAQECVTRGGFQQVIPCAKGFVAVRYNGGGRWDVRAQYAGGGYTQDSTNDLEQVTALQNEYVDRLGGCIEN